MRILTLCYEFPPIGGGGSRVVSGLASELVRAGHGVDLVTMRFGNQPRRQVVGGVRVFRADCIRRSPSICSPPEMATYLARALPLAARLAELEQRLERLATEDETPPASPPAPRP